MLEWHSQKFILDHTVFQTQKKVFQTQEKITKKKHNYAEGQYENVWTTTMFNTKMAYDIYTHVGTFIMFYRTFGYFSYVNNLQFLAKLPQHDNIHTSKLLIFLFLNHTYRIWKHSDKLLEYQIVDFVHYQTCVMYCKITSLLQLPHFAFIESNLSIMLMILITLAAGRRKLPGDVQVEYNRFLCFCVSIVHF